MIYYSLESPIGKKYYAAVDWREPDDPEAEDGPPDVWSTVTGEWQRDSTLNPADLAMPQYAMSEWEVEEVPPEQARTMAQALSLKL